MHLKLVTTRVVVNMPVCLNSYGESLRGYHVYHIDKNDGVSTTIQARGYQSKHLYNILWVRKILVGKTLTDDSQSFPPPYMVFLGARCISWFTLLLPSRCELLWLLIDYFTDQAATIGINESSKVGCMKV